MKFETKARNELSYPSLNELILINQNILRGGVKIENQENLGQCPNFHLGILKTGGGLYFSKSPNFNYFIVYFAILPL